MVDGRDPSDAFGQEKRLQERPCSRVSTAHGGGVHSEELRDFRQREAVPIDKTDDLLIDRLKSE